MIFPWYVNQHNLEVLQGSKIPSCFDTPTQVVFAYVKDEDEGEVDWIGGIAIADKILCGDCGCFISIDDIEALIILSWEDISESIIGF